MQFSYFNHSPLCTIFNNQVLLFDLKDEISDQIWDDIMRAIMGPFLNLRFKLCQPVLYPVSSLLEDAGPSLNDMPLRVCFCNCETSLIET